MDHFTTKLLNLGKLTRGELLRVYRTRAELTQAQFAAHLNMPRNRYSLAERDKVVFDGMAEGLSVLPLETHEACSIARRRSGKTQLQLAEEMNVSRFWLNQMETGLETCKILNEYWTNLNE